jgi:hypothetical protein
MPKFITMAAGTPGGALAFGEVSVLLGLEADPARGVSEHVEGLVLGQGHQLFCRVGTGQLGPRNFLGLVQGQLAAGEGVARPRRFGQDARSLDRGPSLAH